MGDRIRLRKRDQIWFREIVSGTFAFWWLYPSDGFEWRRDLEPRPRQLKQDWKDIQPPWLVARGNGWIRYSPLAETTLHRRFAGLEPGPDSILRFADKFGWLGRQGILVPPMGGTTFRGESLARWQQEVFDLGTFIALWDLVRAKDVGRLGQIVIWAKDSVTINMEVRRKGTEYVIFPSRSPSSVPKDRASISSLLASPKLGPDRADLLDRWKYGDVMGPANYYLCEEVNKRLKGRVYPRVLPLRDNSVYLFPDTLLTAMWLMFSNEITGQTRVLLCPACQQWSELKDPRRMYCSKACKQKMVRARHAK